MTKIIDGKAIAAQIKAEIKTETDQMISSKNLRPGLAVLLVGDNPASQSYVGSKEKACIELGFKSIVEKVPSDYTEAQVLDKINEWNSDDSIHGILVQLPLPKQIDENKVIMAIKPEKDVDGFHPTNLGKMLIGLPALYPCTPAGIIELLLRSDIDLKGKHCVVVGRSNIVGKPIANLLYQKKPGLNAIVTICHTGAKDVSQFTKQADVIIAAMGAPKAIKAADIKEGAVIIDVGTNRIDDPTAKSGSRLVGDVDYDDVFNKVSAITPVPGGVGPMTIAMLMYNTLKSAKSFYNII